MCASEAHGGPYPSENGRLMIGNTRGNALEFTVCHAPHDGIRPAIFLQLGPKGPQVRDSDLNRVVYNYIAPSCSQ